VTSPAPHPAGVLLALTACIVAIFGIAAIWAGISAVTRSQCGWMAVIAALDAALLLRLAVWPPGSGRAAIALVVTLMTVLLANYFVAATQIGLSMGMRPVESVPRMSLELASLYASSNNGWVELLWLGLASAVAWRLGR
jgi:glucan phosphoethanolaminetransferase (alkaline phosphatase superfamily)